MRFVRTFFCFMFILAPYSQGLSAGTITPWGNASLKSYDILLPNSGGMDIVIDGDTAYLAAEWMGLYILDISDLGDVKVRSYIKQSDFGLTGYSLFTIIKHNDYLYCGFRTTGASVTNLKGMLKVVDVSDSSLPVVMGNDTSFSAPTGARLTGLYLNADTNELFAGLRLGGVALFDVSAPANPLLQGWFDPGTVEHQQVVVDREHNRLYAGGWSRGIRYVDITDPDPDNWVEPMPSYPLGRYWYMEQRGKYLYAAVADYKNDLDEGIAIYDLTDNFSDITLPPVRIGYAAIPRDYQCESDPGGKDEGLSGGDPAPHQIYLHGDYAVVGNGCMGIAIFDISDPTNPFYVRSYTIPGQVDWPWSVAKIGNSLLTVGRNKNNTVNNDVYVFTIEPVTFGFEPVLNAEPGAMVYSQPILIKDLPHSVDITIDNGEYSINGQAFTRQQGILTDNDEVQIRIVSSSTYDESVVATVTINGASEGFVVTTAASSDMATNSSSSNDNAVSDNAASISVFSLCIVFLLRVTLVRHRTYSGLRFNTILRR